MVTNDSKAVFQIVGYLNENVDVMLDLIQDKHHNGMKITTNY